VVLWGDPDVQMQNDLEYCLDFTGYDLLSCMVRQQQQQQQQKTTVNGTLAVHWVYDFTCPA